MIHLKVKETLRGWYVLLLEELGEDRKERIEQNGGQLTEDTLKSAFPVLRMYSRPLLQSSEKAPMVVRRSDKSTPSKPLSKASTHQQSHGNRLCRIEQSDEASQEGMLVNTKQNESAKPSENVRRGKPVLRITNRALFLRPILFYLQQAV